MTKREAILREVAKELASRDVDAVDLRKVTIVVMFKQNTQQPRAVLSNLEYGRDADDPGPVNKKFTDTVRAGVP